MKTWIAAGLFLCATGSVCLADGGYWVVGNRATNGCDIVTSNPVLSYAGPLYFGSGPYKSKDDAKIARSTIAACPKVADKPAPKKAAE